MGYIFRYSDKISPLLAELVGTYLLVLVGTSALTAINLADQAQTANTIIFNTLAFGLTLAFLTYSLGRFQAVQLNPAISLTRFLSGRLSLWHLIINVLAQCLGAILASITVGLLFGSPGVEVGLGAIYPMTVSGPLAALAAEIIGSIVLIAAVQFGVTARKSLASQAIIIGLAFAVASLMASAISGASFNPARALAPQIASGDLTAWWVYICGPLTAAIIVAIMSKPAPISASSTTNIQPDTPVETSPEDTETAPQGSADAQSNSFSWTSPLNLSFLKPQDQNTLPQAAISEQESIEAESKSPPRPLEADQLYSPDNSQDQAAPTLHLASDDQPSDNQSPIISFTNLGQSYQNATPAAVSENSTTPEPTPDSDATISPQTPPKESNTSPDKPSSQPTASHPERRTARLTFVNYENQDQDN